MIYVIPTETAEPLKVEDLTAALGKDFARQDFARQDFARQIPCSEYRSELYITPL